MTEPILFMRTSWMNDYKGLPTGEVLESSAKYIVQNKFGHEIFNFQPYAGRMYGFASALGGTINISRLGAGNNDDYVPNVLVIWTAPRRRVGVVIVGWYQHAKVYRKYQPPPTGSNRMAKGHSIGYCVSAKASDCKLILPTDKRVFPVPDMGQSLIWYADAREHAAFVNRVRSYVTRGGNIKSKKGTDAKTSAWQRDAELRLAIESSAIKRAGKYFEDLGYRVNSVERDKKGWDLEARLKNEFLRIEVKGRGSAIPSAELTPQEYQKLLKYTDSYRVCIITSAISKNAKMHLFAYSADTDLWECEQGRCLTFVEKTGAIISY